MMKYNNWGAFVFRGVQRMTKKKKIVKTAQHHQIMNVRYEKKISDSSPDLKRYIIHTTLFLYRREEGKLNRH